jgi:hypothetical protein
MNKIHQVNVTNIEEIIQRVLEIERECNRISELFDGNCKEQIISPDYSKLIIGGVSTSINSVVIDCKNGKIETMTFCGSLGLSAEHLFSLYKHYREAYAPRDEFYFYFFNESRTDDSPIVSFFEPNHNQVNVKTANGSLSNLTIKW